MFGFARGTIRPPEVPKVFSNWKGSMITANRSRPIRKRNNDSSAEGTSPVSPVAPRRYDYVKAAVDFLFGLTMFALSLPLMAAAGLLVKLTSRGPIFYSQTRVGRNGRHFKIFKIRTMYHNCEALTGPQWSSGKGDPRVTWVGRILRKTHVDELPQLWNILRGDMSLVGPRPERPEFVVTLREKIPGYEERLAVKPGLTGLAQIQLPPDSGLESVRRKVVLDRVYMGRYGLWLDLRIMVGTGLYIFGLSYATVRKILSLPGAPEEEQRESFPMGQPQLRNA